MSRLIMRRGPEPGKVYKLDQAVIKIGRGRKNDIIIHDNEISREHCELVRVDGGYEVRDSGSSNGTFVDGQRVGEEGWILKADCIIEMGDSITLEYRAESAKTEDITPAAIHSYLVVVSGNQTTKSEVYPLHGDVIDIGRELSCTIVIPEPEVSRQHLRLRYSELGYMAEDLKSTNGTFLNGEPLELPKLLRLNDVLQLGTLVKLLYTDDPSKYLSDLKTQILAPDDETVQRKTLDDSALIEHVTLNTKTSELGPGLEAGSLRNHIFIAYSSKDWGLVANVYRYLKDRSLPVWVNQYLDQESPEWEAALQMALSECSGLILMVSKAGLETGYVRRALRYFRDHEKPIAAVIVETVSPAPAELRSLPAVNYNSANPQETYLKLVTEIVRLRMTSSKD